LLQSDLEKLSSAKQPWTLYDSMPHDNADVAAKLGQDRPLHDYAYLFGRYRQTISELVDLQQSAIRDLQLTKDTLADAKEQVKFYKNQQTIFEAVAAKFAKQRDVVKSHLDRVQEAYDAAKAAAENLIKTNKAMAGQIAKIQWDETRLIDQRSMAQSTSGRK
jgi:hypothetical protein